MTPMDSDKKPLLIYDGDCGFCRRWIGFCKSLTEEKIEYAPFQQVADQFPEIREEEFLASVQLVEPNGKFSKAAEAVFRTLAYVPGKKWMLWSYEKVPGFARISEWCYCFVAQRRTFFSTLTRLLFGQHLEQSRTFLARWLFLRLLGIVYLSAFISLAVQIDGLVGKEGILPASNFLQAVSQKFGPEKYRLLPTLCWLNSSDSFLTFLCWGGAFFSFLLILGFAPSILLSILWIGYLSLTNVCRDFLYFQWDNLLLETGFLAIFFAPLAIFPKNSNRSEPSTTFLWLLRWLLFRLMFESGCVKLLSGDFTWRNLTALTFHYETQPLPTWIGWYAHQLPIWFQKISVIVMFGIELIAPFLIFSPRRVRMVSFFSLLFLQILILLTGNYSFFNWLTIALTFLLLDDTFLRRFFPKKMRERSYPQNRESLPCRVQSLFRNFLTVTVAGTIIFVSGIQLSGLFFQPMKLPKAFESFLNWVSPFRSINSYGLFAVMTTTRPEIIVEGSNDGQNWLEYKFRWKAGDLNRPPAFVAPHQPRLDWQMWFAALGNYQANPWFIEFLVRLLQGSPKVLSLLSYNPFPETPPQYLRALLYDYRFTDIKTKRSNENWWRRELKGLYCPVVSLKKS